MLWNHGVGWSAAVLQRLGPAALLAPQFSFELPLFLCDRFAVPFRINPHSLSCAGVCPFQFCKHVEILAVRSQEDVARQTFQHREGLSIIIGNAGIRGRLPWPTDQAE